MSETATVAPYRAALSPSRSKDFMQCPLLFRFRAVDRLPEPPSPAAARGTLVHTVLERLFDLPAQARAEDAAVELLDPAWEQMREADPELLSMFATPEALEQWLGQARDLVRTYFRVENPQRLEPARRELAVEVELASGVLLRGFIDRVDVAGDGAVRIVDYKTGRSPRLEYSGDALFQLTFYGLMIWRLHGVVPRRLQLVYLGDERVLTFDPTVDDLLATEARIERLWEQIERAAREGHFRPRTSRLCDWCSFQSLCPSFGGTPPELPAEGIARLLGAVRSPSTGGDGAPGVAGVDETRAAVAAR
jgi:putative RecB family exonuclease